MLKMRQRSWFQGDISVTSLIGAILVMLGLIWLAVGFSSYCEAKRSETLLQRQAEEQGLEEIPGVGHNDMFSLSIAILASGATAASTGILLVLAGTLRKERRDGTRERPTLLNCESAGSAEGRRFCEPTTTEAEEEESSLVTTVVAPQSHQRHANSRFRERMIVFAISIAVLISTLAGLAFTQPWSKIEILASNPHEEPVAMRVYLDGALKADVTAMPSSGYVSIAVWRVHAGTHVVTIDSGRFVMDNGGGQWIYVEPDGVIDMWHSTFLYPLTTMVIEFYPSEGASVTASCSLCD